MDVGAGVLGCDDDCTSAHGDGFGSINPYVGYVEFEEEGVKGNCAGGRFFGVVCDSLDVVECNGDGYNSEWSSSGVSLTGYEPESGAGEGGSGTADSSMSELGRDLIATSDDDLDRLMGIGEGW